MVMRLISLRRGLGGALSLVLLSLMPGPHAAPAGDSITMRLEVFGFAGINVLTLRSHVEETQDRYSITVDYATKGLASAFVDISTRAQATGRLKGGLAEPVSFRSDVRRSGGERHSQIEYHSGGVVESRTTPPLAQQLGAAALRGTVDNLTAYFQLERRLAQTGRCASTVAVFDGRHRYDLQFTDAGQQTLRPVPGQKFTGATIACRMVRRNVGVPEPEQDEGARSGTIWYARLTPGDLLIPVRMQLDTQLGSVDAYLIELHGRGVDLHLTD